MEHTATDGKTYMTSCYNLDVIISELKVLNNLVSGYFDFAEIQAMRKRPMNMKDYILRYNLGMREENSRDTILNCALELFAESGYDAVGVSRIVEAAGVKKPTLYYFFGSKQGLYEELLNTHFSKLFECLEPLCQYSPTDKKDEKELSQLLIGIIKGYFDFAKEYKQFYLMALSPSFSSPSSTAAIAIKPYVDRNYQLIEEVFTQISGTYETIRGKERIASWEFVALIDVRIGLWNHEYSQLRDEDAEHIAKQFLYGLLG